MGRGKTRSTEVDSIKWYEANAGDNVRRNEWKTAGWRTQQERTMFICSVSVSGRELNERRMLHLLLLLLGINDVTAIFSAQRQATREDNNKMRWFVLVCRAMSSFSPHRPSTVRQHLRRLIALADDAWSDIIIAGCLHHLIYSCWAWAGAASPMMKMDWQLMNDLLSEPVAQNGNNHFTCVSAHGLKV